MVRRNRTRNASTGSESRSSYEFAETEAPRRGPGRAEPDAARAATRGSRGPATRPRCIRPGSRRPAGRMPATSAVPNPWNALWAMMVGFFMILVDSTIVAVANPSIMEKLQTDYDAVIWVTSAYLLAYAVPCWSPAASVTSSARRTCT